MNKRCGNVYSVGILQIMKQLKELSSEENRLCVAVEPLPAALVEAYKKILASPHDDLAFQSLLLSLPTEATLVDSMPAPCNPVAVSLARAFVKFSLAQHLYDNFDAVYRRLSAEKKSYSVTYSDIGVRSLRNLCLSYLTSRNPFSADKAAALKLQNKAYTHYVEANNMTDRMGGGRPLPKTFCIPQTNNVFQLCIIFVRTSDVLFEGYGGRA